MTRQQQQQPQRKKKTSSSSSSKRPPQTLKKTTSTQMMQKVYYNPQHSSAFGGKSKLAEQFPSQQVEKWLPTQIAYSLHKPVRKKFPTRSYTTAGLNDLWQMDMLEMGPYAKINKGYKYILVCIDVFNRYVRALPTKTKSGSEVVELLNTMFKDVQPRHVQTDKGKEFYNAEVKKLFDKYHINHYSVTSQFKAAVVERVNRTIREKLNRYFTYKGKKVWYEVLPQIIKTYNNTKHRGIFGYKPAEITKENESLLWQKQNSPQQLHSSSSSSSKPNEKPLKLLEYVRISQISVSQHFNRNFDQNWSDEVFRIVAIDTRVSPTMYVIEDLDHNVIDGKFYKSELQAIHGKPEVYRIEKILETKGKGVYKQYLVKWHGYSSDHNSWIKASQIDSNDNDDNNG